LAQVRELIGEQAGTLVASMLEGASENVGSGILATVLGVVTLVFGATGAFIQLQGSLNTIWGVRAAPDSSILHTLHKRVLSFGMVVVLAFLLLASLVASTALAAAGTFLAGLLPDAIPLAQVLSNLLSFVVISFLFALVYKYLPDVKIAWRNVWMGAAVTGLLFTVGKFLLGLYLGRSSTASVYGAAGALVLLLLWIYYLTQILFFGAEFTQVYARMFGSRIVPDEHAVSIRAAAPGKPGASESDRRAAGPAAAAESQASGASAEVVALLPPPPAGQRALKRVAPKVAVFVVGVLAGIWVVGRRRPD
jgi:membrane protein